MSSLEKRLAAEKRFKFYGMFAMTLSLFFVLILMYKIFSTGSGAFVRTTINADVYFDPNFIEVSSNSSKKEIMKASYVDLADQVINQNHPGLDEENFITCFDFHRGFSFNSPTNNQ